jgi:predicted alpha/beta superfamily hydrolase
MLIYHSYISLNKYKNIFLIFFVFILQLIFASPSLADADKIKKQNNSKPFVLGWVDKIQSNLLSENRTLNIYLPDGYYKDTSLSYPVIYLLDGSSNEDFIHIVGVVQFLSMIQAIPKTIVVGIANVDRKHDFTFPTHIQKDKNDFPTAGGSAKFIEFVEKELQPFIQKKYRTNNSKTLIGQSLGGLFATEVLLNKAQLFNHYIIISPSLWWDNESLLSKAPQLFKRQPDTNVKVYISVGTENKNMQDEAKKLASILRQSGKRNLIIKFDRLPKESHITILHNSVYKALSSMK